MYPRLEVCVVRISRRDPQKGIFVGIDNRSGVPIEKAALDMVYSSRPISIMSLNGEIISVNQMLEELSDNASSNSSLCRVGEQIRTTNESSYDPTVIAIGPFHRGKAHLKAMDHHKKRYLKLILQSRGESSADRYVNSMLESEEEARKFYAEETAVLGKYAFALMLLLDGIFILEFLRECTFGSNLVFQLGQMKSHILRDLMLFENQIPLFILEKLLSMTDDAFQITHLIYPLISPIIVHQEAISLQDDHTKPHHLLGLVHYAERLGFSPTVPDEHYVMENINSATELSEAGISFKKSDSKNLLDIIFKNKKIRMPTLEITDLTESRIRNMIAYEYYNLACDERKYVTDYTFFLHCLIHAPKDAELLRRYGVVSNWLGGDEMVYRLINQIGSHVQTSEKFSYHDVFRDVNVHCRNRKNRWIAVLRRDYFNTPWKLISLVAGFVLLGVGVVQMVFAILSYYQDK
ncbi:PREDICTED: UPF0481 protein At3g47200-like [Erythranthe guttata]|nr:PREDICTED: UPF0481 protein At3g47200-like [Erythranthe guttata]XP_012842911.1 PREDICTED: UPF0481 protein At3g47200-like [Erythranthe guttata]|eukprot:XP_012842910.1 PREDICTED: UPF0481 protein At3g47200-like [Erythranthe guttata]